MELSLPISKNLSAEEIRFNESKATAFNQQLKAQKEQVNHTLGQDDFFRILTAQLANQDPLNPMEDKEFIAQMAQFSSLEEMKGMAKEMRTLSDSVKMNRFASAINLIGREATVYTPAGTITGTVAQISGQEKPLIQIGQNYYDISEIVQIR